MDKWINGWGFRETDFSLFPMYAEDETQRIWFLGNLKSGKLRVRLSNRYSRHAVTIERATVAISDENGVIREGDGKALLYNGSGKITIPAKSVLYSDPVSLDVVPGQWISVSIYIKEKTRLTTAISSQSSIISRMDTAHGDLCTSCEVKGERFFDGARLFRELKPKHGFIPAIVTQVEFLCDESVRKVLYFGDSMTQHEHWSGALTKRLYELLPGQIACCNRGIHGNRVLHDASIRTDFGRYFGEGALERFDEDVFGTPDGYVPDYVVFQIGINDILHPFSAACAPYEKVSADEITDGLNRLVDKVHSYGAKAYGTTVTPFGAFSDAWCPEAEEIRKGINRAVREGRVAYDLFFDFDRIVQDHDDPVKLAAAFDSGDGLHPNEAGGRAIADAIDTGLFK